MKEREARRGVGRERKPRGGEGWRVNMVRERERETEAGVIESVGEVRKKGRSVD